MAGRGRRLGDFADLSKKVGTALPFAEDDASVDMPTLVRKINEINVMGNNTALLNSIDKLFKKLCICKEVVKDVLSDLHSKALGDTTFGEKLVIALEQVSNLEVDNVIVRCELLAFIQGDFKLKDIMSKLNKEKFLNAIMLLGGVYDRIKVCGVPILILGVALLEYFDLLLEGDDDELRVLTKQILINGDKLSESKVLSQKYELLKQNLRNTLVTKNLSKLSKCWILLSLDIMSNDYKPLTGKVKEFYAQELGDNFMEIESLAENLGKNSDISSIFPKSLIIEHDDSVRNSKFDTDQKKKGGKVDLPDRFSDLNVTQQEKEKFKRTKEQLSFGKNTKTENWKWQTDNKPPGSSKGFSTSEHDDRFDKEENFYGVQLPRMHKPEYLKKNFQEGKGSKKGFDSDFKSSFSSKSRESSNQLNS